MTWLSIKMLLAHSLVLQYTIKRIVLVEVFVLSCHLAVGVALTLIVYPKGVEEATENYFF